MGLQHQRHVNYIANIFGLCHHGNGGLVLIMDDGYEITMNCPLLLQQSCLMDGFDYIQIATHGEGCAL